MHIFCLYFKYLGITSWWSGRTKTITLFFCGATALIGPRPPRFGVSRLHKIKTHTHTNVPKAVTYTAYHEHKKRKSMLSAGFESSIPTIKWLQAYALHRTANRISYHVAYCYQINLVHS